jgi:hypothetical protein
MQLFCYSVNSLNDTRSYIYLETSVWQLNIRRLGTNPPLTRKSNLIPPFGAALCEILPHHTARCVEFLLGYATVFVLHTSATSNSGCSTLCFLIHGSRQRRIAETQLFCVHAMLQDSLPSKSVLFMYTIYIYIYIYTYIHTHRLKERAPQRTSLVTTKPAT